MWTGRAVHTDGRRELIVAVVHGTSRAVSRQSLFALFLAYGAARCVVVPLQIFFFQLPHDRQFLRPADSCSEKTKDTVNLGQGFETHEKKLKELSLSENMNFAGAYCTVHDSLSGIHPGTIFHRMKVLLGSTSYFRMVFRGEGKISYIFGKKFSNMPTK